MEKQAKEEILSKLYTLRVGMALLSIEKDKIDKNNNAKQKEKKAWQEKKSNIKQDIDQNNKKIKNERATKKNRQYYFAKANRRILGDFSTFIFLIVLSVVLISISFFLGYWFYLFCIADMGEEDVAQKLLSLANNDIPIFSTFNHWYIEFNELILKMDEQSILYSLVTILFFIVLTIGTLGVLVLAVFSFISGIKNFLQGIQDIEAKRISPQIIQKATNRIAVLEEQNERKKEILCQLDSKTQSNIKHLDQKIEREYSEVGSLYAVLNKEFSPFLQPTDWGNVDLLIHYFHTGRAESMKEALQLVDEERRYRDLISAINNASRQICGTINNAFMQLQSSMTQCFALLSEQLDLMHQQQMESISALNGKMKELSNNVAAIKKDQELSNKLNTSSLQMMEGIYQAVKEEEARKHRNGIW